GSKRRQKGLAKAGNARVRRGLIQLAWREGPVQIKRGVSTLVRAGVLENGGLWTRVFADRSASRQLIAIACRWRLTQPFAAEALI
ncbi:hypothetical protein ACWGTI_32830, partial [Mesorhizobium sp. ArgA1]